MYSTDPDAAILESLGYKQELVRVFRPVEIFGIAFSALCIVPGISSVLIYAIPNGGPVAMIWGWFTVAPFTICIALSLAELASAAPTSGGLYYWTHQFANPRWGDVLAWVVGYTNTLAYITGLAAGNWGTALMVSAAGVIGSDFVWIPTTAQIFGIFCALILSQAIICSLASRFIARLQWLYIIFNAALIMIIIVGLPASTSSGSLNSARYVFGHFENISGWSNGFSFILSFLSPLFAFAGYDAPIHLSEEASNANTTVPRAIVAAVVIDSIVGWAVMISIAFCMGPDLLSILSSPIGQPMAVILLNSFGKHGMLVVWSLFIVTYWMALTNLLSAGSRQVFAFARDGALPMSALLYRINHVTQTPINCVWFTSILAILPGLLAFAGSAAISAVFAMLIAALYVTYMIPIITRFVFDNNFKPGPFSLGALSLPVAVIAVLWMSFAIVVMFFPTVPSPTAQTMNYAVVVMGGVLGISLAYFYLPRYGAWRWFKGPKKTATTDQRVGSADTVEEMKVE